jgi:hypothetical protein
MYLSRVASLELTHSFAVSAPKYFCEDSFQGGGWVLVRRVKQGSTWHQSTDNLQGTSVYGTYGTPTSDLTFSIAWQGWGTELLLTTGMM